MIAYFGFGKMMSVPYFHLFISNINLYREINPQASADASGRNGKQFLIKDIVHPSSRPLPAAFLHPPHWTQHTLLFSSPQIQRAQEKSGQEKCK